MANNNNFIRGLFWTLIIGSFGWATTIGFMNMKALADHSKNAEAGMAAIKTEMIVRDETILEKLLLKLEAMNETLTTLKTDVKHILENNNK